MYCLILLPFFLKYLTNAKMCSVVNLLRQNPHWCSPIISSIYGLNLERRGVDKNLYEAGSSDIPWQLLVIFIALLVSWYNKRLLPLIRQFFFTPNRVNGFMDLRPLCSTSCSNQFCQNLITTWQFTYYHFKIAISTSKGLWSGPHGSAVCIFICLTSLALCTLNNWEKQFFYLHKMLWESASRSPFSSFTKSRVVTRL
jgi:hypothetical protein